MDIENGLEMGKVPLTNGFEDSPEIKSIQSGSPEDDDVYLEELPPWTLKEIVIAVLAAGSGEMIINFQYCTVRIKYS